VNAILVISDGLKTLMSRTISIASNVAQGDRNGISEGTND
jgi:hypothetical protein